MVEVVTVTVTVVNEVVPEVLCVVVEMVDVPEIVVVVTV